MTDRKRVEEILGPCEDLEALIDAIETAAKEDAFDLIAGTDPIPSNMMDVRALRLRRICETLKRGLTPREIRIIFRVGESTARSIESRMTATYPRQMDDIKAARIAAMRAGAKARVVKSKDGDTQYKIRFSPRSALEFAFELLDDEGHLQDVERDGEEHLLLPLRATDRAGRRINLLTDILGLPDPEQR